MNAPNENSPRLTANSRTLGLDHYEFPSKNVVPVDWQKLASVDLHDLDSGNCSVELLQEHLNHIAFCQAQKDLNIESAAGQRSLLKMFRLAQLTIQYLFISQQYIEAQLDRTKEETQALTQKYNQLKETLVVQKEEAKKLKKSNKNMNESIVYLNSLLSSIGALEHFRCPFCFKAFRSKEFLQSHLLRKHPIQASSVDISKCFVQNAYIDISHPENASFQASNDFINFPIAKNSQNLPDQKKVEQQFDDLKPGLSKEYGNCCNGRQRTTASEDKQTRFTDQPSTSKTQSYSAFYMDTHILNDDLKEVGSSGLAVRPKVNEGLVMNRQIDEKGKSNDVDLYKLNEMQKSFSVMNDVVIKLSKDLETQKQILELEKINRSKDMEKNLNETSRMKENYEKTIEKLKDEIESLNKEIKKSANENEKIIRNLTEKQEQEFNILKENMKIKTTPEAEKNATKNNKKLQMQLKHMKTDIQEMDGRYERKLLKLSEQMRKEYEEALLKEREKHKAQLPNVTHMNSGMTSTINKPPIPAHTKPKVENPKMVEKATKIISTPMYEDGNQRDSSNMDEAESSSDTTKWYQKGNKRLQESSSEEEMDESSGESRDTDGYEVPISKNRKELNARIEDQTKRGLGIMQSKYKGEHKYEDINEIKNENSSREEGERILKLEQLIEKNPGLWKQMRDITGEELERRLNQLNISGQKGISSRTLNSHLIKLKNGRKKLNKKYEGFQNLRKSLENQIIYKIQGARQRNRRETENKKSSHTRRGFKDGIESMSTKLKMNKNSQSPFKTNLSDMGDSKWKNQKEETLSMNEDNESYSSDGNHSDMSEQFDIESDKNKNINDHQSDVSENWSSSEGNPAPNEMQVDIHAERSQSVKRSLFNNSPISVSPPLPRRQSFFENETYANFKQENWDSDSSYSSTEEEKKGEFVQNQITLKENNNYSLTDNDSSPGKEVYPDIKLRKPSGAMVKQLSKQIEDQLRVRAHIKPAGAIDVMRVGGKISQENTSDIESCFTDSD